VMSGLASTVCIRKVSYQGRWHLTLWAIPLAREA
jgi:hypothetical protein